MATQNNVIIKQDNYCKIIKEIRDINDRQDLSFNQLRLDLDKGISFEKNLEDDLVKYIISAYYTHNLGQNFPLMCIPKNPVFNVDFINNAFRIQKRVADKICLDTNCTIAGYKLG